MKAENEKIDNLIREALSKEEAAYYDELNEQSTLEMVTAIYKGKNRWMNILVAILTTAFFGVGIYTLIRFFEAESTKDMLKWSLGFIYCILSASIMKIWGWMEINKKALIREIKRLELQIAILVGKQEK